MYSWCSALGIDQNVLAYAAFAGRQYAGVLILLPFMLPVLKILAYIIPDPTMRKVGSL